MKVSLAFGCNLVCLGQVNWLKGDQWQLKFKTLLTIEYYGLEKKKKKRERRKSIPDWYINIIQVMFGITAKFPVKVGSQLRM